MLKKKSISGSGYPKRITQFFSIGFVYLFMGLVIACERGNEASADSILNPNQNVDKPVSAIADSDPLYSCEESEDQTQNGATSESCDPQDGVLLPNPVLEEPLTPREK